MNRTHRVLWSDSLQAFVVTSEHSKTRGKPGSTRKALATAVALGLGSLLSAEAYAAGSCSNGGASVIRQPVTITCTLASGGTLNVNTTGAISVASGPAVLLDQAASTATHGSVNDALLVRNAGQLSGSDAIVLDHTAVSGLISNTAGATLRSDAGAGVLLNSSSLDGSVINAGLIATTRGSGIQVVESAVAGNLDNRNAISSTLGIGVQGSSIGGSILDRGNISSDAYAIQVAQSAIGGSVGVQGSAAGGQGALRLSEDAVGGTVTNSGSLWSQQTAVALDRTVVQGNLGNSGTIAGSTGLAVSEGGFRSLGNSGTITGNDFAVQVSQAQVSGGIDNSGVIAIVAPNWDGAPNPNIGSGLDIELSSVARDIVNSGTISGGSLGGAGVKIGGSGLAGSIRNSGTISGQDLGLHLFSSSLKGSLVNDGVITANTGFTGTTGTALRLTGDVVAGSVINNGLVGGWNTGLHLDRNLIKGDVLNTGTIYGNLNAGVLLTYTDVDGNLRNSGTVIGGLQDAIRLENSSLSQGSLVNEGYIGGGRGIVLENSSVARDVLNTGTVSASTAGFELQGSRVGGALLNQGSISGHSLGTINVDDHSSVAQGIVNSGSISNSAGGAAIRVNDSQVLAGRIVNSGSLTAVAGGVVVSGSTVTGGIVNSGTLVAGDPLNNDTDGVLLSNSALHGDLANSGSITGRIALDVLGSTISGNILNAGTLSSYTPAIQLRDSLLDGNVVNTSTGVTSGLQALEVYNSTITGQIVNAGQEHGGFLGMDIYGSTVAGGFTNSGTLTAGISSNNISSFSIGDIVNRGTLSGYQYGLALSGGVVHGTIDNQGGTLSGSSGLVVQNSLIDGAIYNSGTIAGQQLGVGLDMSGSTLAGSIVNDGTITTDQTSFVQTGIGMRLSNDVIAGSLVNNGSLFGWNTGLLVDGTQLAGSLLNTGNITGNFNAALLVNDSTIGGDLHNSGEVNGGLVDAVRVQNSSVGGSVINDGFLTGASRGIALLNSTVARDVINTGSMSVSTFGINLDASQIGGSLSNSGSISGHSTAILYVSDGSTIGNGIVNQGSLLNSAGGSAIAVQGSQILDGGISNSGTAAGVVGGLVVKDSTVSGGISNTGLISGDLNGAGGTGGSSPIAAVELDNSTITGNLYNSGTLLSANPTLGGNNGLSLSHSLLNGSIVNEGSISGSNSISIDTSVINGDIINAGTLGGYAIPIYLGASVVNGNLINTADLSALTSLVIQGSTITGNLENSAEIHGGYQGLLVRDSVIGHDFVNTGTYITYLGQNEFTNTSMQRLNNSGTLYGGGNGLLIQGSQISVALDNSGTIHGNDVGVNIVDSTLGSFVNSGTISGYNYAVLADASLRQLTIAGNNTAVFSGEVSAPEAHVSIAQGAAYTMNAGNLFTVADFTNYGTLTVASNATGTIAGNYIQDANGTLSTQALNATTFGKLNVTGTATLPDQARFNVDVVDSGQSFSGATLSNVLSAGTLNSNGTYAVTSNSALYNFSGVKDGNSVDLIAAPKSTTAVTQALQSSGASTNLSAARVLDSAIASNSSLTPFFVGATSGAGVASAVSQTLPSNAVAASQVSQSTLSTITDVIQSRIDANTGLASGDGFYGDKNLWMKPFGSWINQSQHGNTPGYDASVYGMAFGVDAPVNELTRLGVSFSYANADTNSKADVAAQSAKVDLYQLMGYGSYTLAPDTELSFHAGVGQNRNDGERNISLNGIGGKAKADYDSRSFTAGVALAKAFDLSPTTRFIPSVRADYTWMKDDSYHEKGNAALQPLLLDVDKHQTDQLILGIDGKLSHEIVPGTQVTGNLGVGYDVIHDDSMLTSAYAGAPGQTFNTVGQSSSPWLARGGVGLTTKVAANGTELSVNYDAEARTDFTNQTVSLKLKVPF